MGRWGATYDVYGSVVLTGPELKEFMLGYEAQEVSDFYSAMCHGPVYGFRLYEEGRLVREVAVCWSCSNFSFAILPGVMSGSGFDSRSKQAQRLLEFCEKRLPFRKTN